MQRAPSRLGPKRIIRSIQIRATISTTRDPPTTPPPHVRTKKEEYELLKAPKRPKRKSRIAALRLKLNNKTKLSRLSAVLNQSPTVLNPDITNEARYTNKK